MTLLTSMSHSNHHHDDDEQQQQRHQDNTHDDTDNCIVTETTCFIGYDCKQQQQ